MRAAKQFLTYVSGAPFQPAIAAALALPDSFYDDLAAGLQAKRDLLSEGLRSAGLTVFPSAGTYFVVTDVTPLGFADGAELCWSLPERVGSRPRCPSRCSAPTRASVARWCGSRSASATRC